MFNVTVKVLQKNFLYYWKIVTKYNYNINKLVQNIQIINN
jgi:hypothetical protein